jgi:hypothetical protein
MIVLYVRGGAPVLDPVSGSRYLICTWVSIPVILWPLWRLRPPIARISAFALLFLALFHSIAMTCNEIPKAQAENAQLAALVSYLEKHDITRFYSEYWTCNRLIMASQEHLICADTWNVNGKLTHGTDRYGAYREAIESSRDPALVYPAGDSRIAVAVQVLKTEKIGHQITEVAGHVVILPRGTAPIQEKPRKH